MKLTIEEWRRAKKIPQHELAKAMGISEGTYRRKAIANGDFYVSELAKGAAYMKVPIDQVAF